MKTKAQTNAGLWAIFLDWMAVSALGLALAGCEGETELTSDGEEDSDVRVEAEAEPEGPADPDAEPDGEAEAWEDADTIEEGDEDVEEICSHAGTTSFHVADPLSETGLADVTVLVQDGCGERTFTTDPSGDVTIDGVDLASDAPNVTFFLSGRTYLTLAGLDRDFEDPVLLNPLEPYEGTEATGTVTGMGEGATARVFPNPSWEGGGAPAGVFANGSYSTTLVERPGATEVSISALAYEEDTYAVANFVDAVVPFTDGKPVVADLEFPAPAAAISRSTVSLLLPPASETFTPVPIPFNPWGFDGDLGFVSVWDGVRSIRIGMAEHIEALASPAGLAITIGWDSGLAGLTAGDALISFVIALDDGGSSGANWRQWGLPVDGDTIQLPAAPEFVVPAPGVTLEAGTETMEWNVPDSADWIQFVVVYFMGYMGYTLWEVWAPPRVTTFRFPPEPSSLPPVAPTRCNPYVSLECMLGAVAIVIDDGRRTSFCEPTTSRPIPASPVGGVWGVKALVTF